MLNKIQSQEQQLKKPAKSMSGVTPITVVLPQKECWHGTCTYCPAFENVPSSYTPKSPSIISAIAMDYDPYKQISAKLKIREKMGHPTDKIELIIIGGTFMQYHLHYRDEFIRRCFDALNENESGSKTIAEAQKKNETAKYRCVALCIENRPDNCSLPQIQKMREYGCTRVELGVQCLDDNIYKRINRGHLIKHVIEATQNLKDAGFKVGYHMMPGLPGSNPLKDIDNFKELFKNENYKPDQLKIYPCQVIQKTELEKEYWQGKFIPYTREILEKILKDMYNIVPRYCRVMRIMREFPTEYMVAGVTKIDIRKDIESELRRKNSKIKEIRYREIGFHISRINKINTDLILKTTEYKASKGKEFFLEIVNEDNILFGLLRLRFPYKTEIQELNNCALIRELHVYGNATEIGKKGKVQHTGLGKKLMQKSEEIAKNKGYKKIAVISGVGVKEYYRKLGYKDTEGTYLVKEL
jgi:elongator complex protein 3